MRRLIGLARPARVVLAGMLAASITGALAGTFQQVALGRAIDRLATGGSGAAAWWLGALIACVAGSAIAYGASDVLYAAAAARIFSRLRQSMADGLRALPSKRGIATRFVSDVEAVEGVLVDSLDTSAIALFELASGLVAIGVIAPWAAAVAAGAAAGAAGLARLTQRPIAHSVTQRQEALEDLAAEVERRSTGKLGAGIERLRVADLAVARTHALAGYTSHGAAGLVPIVVVLAGGGWSLHRAGTLLSLYLLSERAARAAEDITDLGISIEALRGPLARCLELVDAG